MKRLKTETLEEYINALWLSLSDKTYSYDYLLELKDQHKLSNLEYSKLREKFINHRDNADQSNEQ